MGDLFFQVNAQYSFNITSLVVQYIPPCLSEHFSIMKNCLMNIFSTVPNSFSFLAYLKLMNTYHNKHSEASSEGVHYF